MSAAEALGGTVWLFIPLGILAAVLVFGIWVFHRFVPSIAERL